MDGNGCWLGLPSTAWLEARQGVGGEFKTREDSRSRPGGYQDGEYREDDADFKPSFPIRKEVAVDGVTVRTLPDGRGLTLMHRGPQDQLGRSYAKILQHANERKLTLTIPTREVYVKGPGLIFKGNPKNYLTEVQLPCG
jgi:effector-binding domain-containing protein